MRLSRYTLFYDNYPSENEYLALNTRTQAIVVVNKELKDVMEKLPANGRLTAQDYEYLNQLKDIGILIDDEVDEAKLLEHWFNEIKYQSSKMTVMILTTYKCNFACGYCFEDAVKRSDWEMDDETTLKTIEWLKDEVMRKRPKGLRIVFYGGEPFLNPAPMLEIAEEMNKWAKEKGVKFNFGIITNGSILNPSFIEQLREAGLTNIRVTLDGAPEAHNKKRPFRNGYGTFDVIFRNIEAVADKVRVDIGGNFDRENLAGFTELLDLFKEKGLDKKIGTVLFAPIVARMGQDASTIEMTGCTSLSHDLMEEALKLRRETIRRGFKVEGGVAITTCPMTRDGAMFVIDPKGDIYKCAAFVGRDGFSVGNVREQHLNYRNVEFMTMKSPLADDKCRDCRYLPMCQGGCCFSAQLQYQDCSRVACDKEYYEKILPELVKIEYERGAL